MRRARSAPADARQRLLETADRLFYAEGIRNVGIDRVIAEAGAAKATLSAHFASKDALIVAVLRHREAQVLEFFRASMARHAARSRSGLRAFFAALGEWFASPGFRGCAFQNAAAELADAGHPGARFVRGHKRRFAGIIRGLVDEAVGPASRQLAPMVALLVEGAIVTAAITGTPDPARVARNAALRLLGEGRA